MPASPHPRPAPAVAHEHEAFSLPLFALTVVVSLAGLLGALRLIAPATWSQQFLPSFAHAAAAFVAVSLVNCFVEFFFHRYVLHLPAVPFLRRLYQQHTLHHALTHVARRQSADGRGILFIENKFPIVEPEQGEASFFPWYSLAVFALVLTPLLAALQRLLPAFPWFFAGFVALAVSLTLYEVIHAINHWPFEQWEPLIRHPRWGWLWRPAYAFHLRHHAVTDCNESISGFFGLPVADWVFGTCVIPQTIYAQGEAWSPDKFAHPRPRWLIRRLDTWAVGVVQRRRHAAATTRAVAAGSHPAEELASWVTHGIGLAASVAGLTLLIVFASLRGTAWHVVSFTVFGLTLLLLHAATTLYRLRREGRARRVFKKLSYVAVFLLIGGTATPFLLTHARGPLSWTLLGIVWGLCGAGAVFQLLFGDRHRLTTTLACVLVAWVGFVALQPSIASVPRGGIALLAAGGLCYAAGLLFHLWQRLRYRHAVWETFVLGGSTCHCLAVLLFLLPAR